MNVTKPDGNANYTDGSTANLSSRAFFKKALNGTQNISDPLISKTDGKLVIVIATPIRDAGGKIVGVLSAALDGQFLSKQCKSINVGKAGYGFVLNSVGTTIGHKDQSKVIGQDNVINNSKKDSSLSALAAIDKNMIRGSKGVSSYVYKGAVKRIAYSPIPGTTWSLGVGAEESDVFSSLTALRTQAITLSVVFILIIIAYVPYYYPLYDYKAYKKDRRYDTGAFNGAS